MKTVYTDNSGFMYGTPAAVNHDTGTLYINEPLFNALTPFQQEFVKQHEIGHYRKQTHDEFIADQYAFNKMVGKYHQSLKQSIGTLEAILDGDDAEHKARIERMYQLALQWDADHGNELAAKELLHISSELSKFRQEKKRGNDYIGFSRADGKNTTTNQVATTQGDSMNELAKTLAAWQINQTKAEDSGENTKTMMYLILALIVFIWWNSNDKK